MPIKRTVIDPAYREGNPDPDKGNESEVPVRKLCKTWPFRKICARRGP